MSFFSSGSAYRGPKEIRYLFIDGGYFRKVIERFGERYFGDSSVPVDYQLVDGKMVAYGFTKIFYYDCLAPRKEAESEVDYKERVARQEAHFKKLRSLDGWHVVQGVVKGTGGRARQKEVDIQIAVDMLTHSYRRNMHRVSFIAGDRDFRPLVEAVVREGMFIELWYEPSSASDELASAADARRMLDVYALHGMLDPKYQSAHPLPERSYQFGKNLEDAVLIGKGKTENGETIELFQEKNRFMIVQADVEDGHFLHMRHGDVSFLKKFHAAIYGTTWSGAAA